MPWLKCSNCAALAHSEHSLYSEQVGIAVGVVAAVVVVALIIAFLLCCRRRKASAADSGLNGAELGYPKPSQVCCHDIYCRLRWLCDHRPAYMHNTA